ncbi:MAG: hypothetical protein WDO71_28175 [Bacteroidota bacterium]
MRNSEKYRARNVQLRDGFYIEVCNKGFKKGMKIRSDSQQTMDDAAAMYAGYKYVIILGQYKDGVPFKGIAA